ncbi:MAG: hypothetical protein LC808_07535 [Actinobacteria bacterium]|nr:hypothetical protein [Actinomycetota bacterium]
MPSPVTESLVVHWRPTVRYHQHRLDILAELKADGSLKEWHVESDEIGARTDRVQLTLEEQGVSVNPKGSLLDDDVLDLLRLAFRCVAPPRYHFTLTLMYLMPIPDKSNDAARRDALSRLSLGPLAASDFAMLIEGSVSDAKWRCEFGVLSEEEVEPRMRRWVGRIRERSSPIPRFVDLPSEVAPASLFVDFACLVPDRSARDEDSVEDVADQIRSLRVEADGIVESIQAQVSEGSLQPVAEGSEP